MHTTFIFITCGFFFFKNYASNLKGYSEFFCLLFYFSSHEEREISYLLAILLLNTYGYTCAFLFKDRDRSSENYGAIGITGK